VTWNPAITMNSRAVGTHQHWLQMQTIYDQACNLQPLPRYDWNYLSAHYILERPGVASDDGIRARLPAELIGVQLGNLELDFIDFILNYERTRVISLCGPRGAGKTSFVHYVEAALQQSKVPNCPIFLIVGNLAGIEESGDIDRANHDVALLVAAEIERAIEIHGLQSRAALQKVAIDLRAAKTPADTRECFRVLSQTMDPREFRRLVLVFDNVDHLISSTISLIFDLARAIYVVSNIACVVCIRPNCFSGASARGDARAFFHYQIDLPAPAVSAWISRLGFRLAAEAARYHETPIVIGGREMQSSDWESGFSTLSGFLSKQDVQNDILSLMQAISADDTRHLVMLFRRVICNRSFPFAQLLEGKTLADFHPLPAFFDGPNFMFVGDNVVPNLLRSADDAGSYDLLIMFRLLSLFSRGVPVLVAEIEARMALFDYSPDVTLRALRYLHGPLLIRGSDQDTFVPIPPTEINLTEAGEYYFQHLLRNSDYLLHAATDVTGAHERYLRSFERDPVRIQEGSSFVERLDSLLEYAERVSKLELGHITSVYSTQILSAGRPARVPRRGRLDTAAGI
jgi:hypothetical protein